MREIGRKEAGELRGFPISWMWIMDSDMENRKCQMEGKESKVQERLKMCRRKSNARVGEVL